MELTLEKRVGIFFLLAIITLGVMIELVEDWNPFEKRQVYSAFFKAAVGIKVGDPVRIAGVDVGKIKTIAIDNSRVRVDFYVVDGTQIREDSMASIQQTNLLGGQFLGLTFGSTTAQILASGGTVPTREIATLEELIDSFNRNQNRAFSMVEEILEDSREPFVGLLHRLETVAVKIDEGDGTLGKLVNDPALYNELHGAIAQVREIVSGVQKGEGTLGRLVVDPALYNNINSTAEHLSTISEQVASGKGTLGRLVKDDEVYENLSDALADIRAIVAKANEGKGTIGKLINDDALYQQTTSTMTRANSILGKIDDGKGTLGRLVNEDGLYREAETTLQKIEKTVDGLSDSGPLSALGVVTGTLF